MKIKLSGAKKKKNKSLLEQIGLGEFWMKAHYADIGIVNVIRQFADWRLRTEDRRMQIVDCKLLNAKRILE